jgi:hypothetical protein
MVPIIALAARQPTVETLRSLVVCGCALALILARHPLPY